MASPLLSRLAWLAGSSSPAAIDDRGRVSHAELAARALAAARALGAPLGGRRVALLAEKDIDWLAAFLGIVVGGGVAVPLSPAYPAAELAWFAEDAGADIAIVGPEHAALAASMAAGRRVLAPGDLFDAAPARLDAGARGPDDGAVLFYTSG